MPLEGHLARYLTSSLLGYYLHAHANAKQTPSSTSDRIERIRYQSRFNVDALMQSCIDKGRYDGYTFAQKRDPCMSMFRKVMCLFTPVPNALAGQGDGHSVSVTISANTTGFPLETSSSGHKPGNVLVARTDECHMKALDAETLEPIGMAHQRSLHPLLKGQLSASHAKSDPQTGDVFNYNLDLIGRYPAYRVFKTSAATGETSILATISAPEVKAAYMHSFFLSANFVVLAIWSAHLKAGGISVLWEKNIMDAIAPFADDQTVKWFVIDRRHGQGVVACFESAAAFSFHSINAFEEPAGTAGGLQEEEDSGTRIDILCDCIEYENFNVVHKFYYENMRSSAPSTSTVKGSFDKQSRFGQHFARYRLGYIPSSSTLSKLPPLSTGELESARQLPAYRQAQKVLQLRAAGAIGDIPTLNPSRLTKEHRYFWNCTFDSAKSSFMEGLCKVDIVESQRLGKPVGVKWKNPPGHTPGEGIFVADPDGTEEDDGVLLTIVLDGFNETSYLLCLDARTMEKLGRADCAGPLAFQFHGQHVNSKGDRPIDV